MARNGNCTPVDRQGRPWVQGFLLLQCCLFGSIGCRPALSPQRSNSETAVVHTAKNWEDWVAAIEQEQSQEFRFTELPLTSEQATQLVAMGQNLTVVEMDQSQLSHQELATTLRGLPSLRQLKLTGETPDAHLSLIVENVPELKFLNLTRGTFLDQGLQVLASLEHLELLRFHSPNVTNASLETISQIASLRFLHLVDVPVTDAGLQNLYDWHKLESFYLDGGECTEDGLSNLIKARPKLHFHWNQLHLENDPHTHPH